MLKINILLILSQAYRIGTPQLGLRMCIFNLPAQVLLPHCACSLCGPGDAIPQRRPYASRGAKCAVQHLVLLKHAACVWASCSGRHCGEFSDGGRPAVQPAAVPACSVPHPASRPLHPAARQSCCSRSAGLSPARCFIQLQAGYKWL